MKEWEFWSENLFLLYQFSKISNLHFIIFSQKFEEEGAKTVKIDGFKMVQSMAASIEAMMQHKIDAIKVGEIQRLIDT